MESTVLSVLKLQLSASTSFHKFLPARKFSIYVTQSIRQPPCCCTKLCWVCDSYCNTSWMPSPPRFLLLIGQVNLKSVLFRSTIFHRFSRMCFIVHFFFVCFTNPNNVCAFHTVTHMALVWLGKVHFSLFLPVVINYTDIVLARSAGGLLDSFGGSSKVRH